jgi:hypothetical protein
MRRGESRVLRPSQARDYPMREICQVPRLRSSTQEIFLAYYPL